MVPVSGRRVVRDGIITVELKGTPEEIGNAHGVLLKDEVRRSYFELIENRVFPSLGMELFGGDKAKIEKFIEWCRYKAELFSKQISADYQAEMDALAAASGLRREDVLLLQVFLDIVEQAGFIHSDRFFHACTQAAFLPSVAGGQMLTARNLDWPPFGVAHELCVLFHYIPTEGIPFWSMGWAGAIGTLTAINRAGIYVSEESLTGSTEDISDGGVPTFLLHRSLVQYEDTLAGAVQTLRSAPRTNGYHTLIASGQEKDAALILHSANHSSVRKPIKGICWGVETERDNPSIYSDGIFPPAAVPLSDDTSDFRYDRFKQLACPAEFPINEQKLIRWLGDNIDIESGQPGTDLHCLSNETTIQSMVANLTTGDFHVAMGSVPAPTGEYVKFNVNETL